MRIAAGMVAKHTIAEDVSFFGIIHQVQYWYFYISNSCLVTKYQLYIVDATVMAHLTLNQRVQAYIQHLMIVLMCLIAIGCITC